MTSLLLYLTIGICTAMAQSTTVSGTVVTETEGEPIIGASVLVKGTNVGTITGINGEFTLSNVPSSSQTLIVSFIGMEPAEVPISKKPIKVALKESSLLIDEVIVTAFGKEKRSSFTGSAAVVGAEKIAKRQVTNVMDALSGTVAGVQMISSSGSPEAEPTMRIRGFSSKSAGMDPLIIVDGMPYDGKWNDINPNDVESITVLKDAASNALYGARGANGVIMITTKNAARGSSQISLDAKWGVNSLAVQQYDYIDDPGEYYAAHYAALRNYYINNGSSALAAHQRANQTLGASTDGGLGYMVYRVPQGEYLIGENGKLNPNATLGNTVSYNGKNYLLLPDDWMEEAFRNGLRQEYNLNINGGNATNQFYASLGFLKNEGIAKASEYTRYSFRLKDTYQARKWLKVGANLNYTHSDTNYATSGTEASLFHMTSTIAPIYPVYLRDGEGNIMQDGNGNMYDYGNYDNAGLYRPMSPNSNSLQTDMLDTSNYSINGMNLQGFAEISLPLGFRFTANMGINNTEGRYKSTGQPFYGFGSSDNGSVYVEHYRDFSLNAQQLLNWDYSFDKHNISFLAGHEYYKLKKTDLDGSRTHMFSYFGNQELDGAVLNTDMSSNTSDYNTEGYFLRGQYNYDEKYFLSASYRRDASSRFHPDHRWGNFWSLGGAWLLNKEEWFSAEWVNMLKLKVSYGMQGNDNIGESRYTDTYSIINSNDEVSLTFLNKGKEDITWESNANFNAGIDFNLLGNRINGSIDYFYRKTTDMLSWRSAPIHLGYTGYYDNVGDMVNKGVELDLDITAIKTRQFTWSINLNMTHYKNKFTYLSEDNRTMDVEGYKGYSGGDNYYGEGLPLYEWYLKRYAGVDTDGQSMWYYTDRDGNLQRTKTWSDADYYLCGSPIPDLYGGFGTSIAYAGFDLSVSFNYQIGGKAYDSGYAASMTPPSGSMAGYNYHKDIWKSWSETNRNSDIPRWQYNDIYSASSSDRWLTNASYLSLQSINVGYTFPKSMMRKMFVENLRLYVSCDNVCYLSKRRGFDPRYSFNGSTTPNRYMPMRTISGGLTVQF